MIKILLADDHQMFIDGIRSFLENYDDIQVVAEANNGQQVIAALKMQSAPIDIAVLDVEMPNLDGIETCKIIREQYAPTKVLIVSMFKKKEFILKLMQNGASGYILKEKTQETLVTAIKQIYAGKPYFDLEVLSIATSATPIVEEKVDLSEREVEVMCHLATGFNAKKTGELLHISEHTANTHRRNLFTKLNIHNVVELTRYAIRHDYIKP